MFNNDDVHDPVSYGFVVSAAYFCESYYLNDFSADIESFRQF